MNRTAFMMIDLGAGDKLTEHDLSSISAKVTIALGSEDNMVSAEESEWAANVIPEASFELIEGFYHPFEKNEPEQLSRLMLNQVGMSDS
jgi:surfactin synthase thioesterase subunit